ncbi:sporulation peptidase YabG [Salsuginibacillus kocurii]|uniref:sporulation peptidase YabG n=1 Tax=Salsuginibacillus kocurii TaxID=427078 RepID=UPI00036D5BE5|nr:sporulation peptidase YabG [Salsuginibacillus kocurii]
MRFASGDLVSRKSYGSDIVFRITDIQNDVAQLIGEDVRLGADAPLSDLVQVDDDDLNERQKVEKERADKCYRLFRQDAKTLREQNEYEMSAGYESEEGYFEKRGRVLHIDGDSKYLDKCTHVYERIGIPVYGAHVAEKDMPEEIDSLLEMVRPDILVITGHDAYLSSKGKPNEIKAYRNSKFFGQAVRKARKFEPHLDDLVIFAGACQSYFDWLLRAGSNYASSPERVNIHALDPVYIAARVSITPFMNRVRLYDLLRNTPTGASGLGGLDTKGVLRRGMPKQDEDATYRLRS